MHSLAKHGETAIDIQGNISFRNSWDYNQEDECAPIGLHSPEDKQRNLTQCILYASMHINS